MEEEEITFDTLGECILSVDLSQVDEFTALVQRVERLECLSAKVLRQAKPKAMDIRDMRDMLGLGVITINEARSMLGLPDRTP